VKLITFTTGMTASGEDRYGQRVIAWLPVAAETFSAAGEGWQHLDHRAIVEHDRLLGRPAHRIGVYQER
jgi:hypothetical protein